MSRVTSDSERIAQLVTWGMLDVDVGDLQHHQRDGLHAGINWRLALVVLVTIPVLLSVAVQFKKRILVQFRLVRKINSKITGEYNQNITGVRVVKALGREEANLGEFSESPMRCTARLTGPPGCRRCSCRWCRSSAPSRWARSCSTAG